MTGATDGVVQTLRGLVDTHGGDRVTTDATWVRNILADLSPETRAFNRVLMVAVQEGIPTDLRRAAAGGSVALAIARGVNRLVGDYAIERGAATDAVNAWARIVGSAGTVAPAPVPPPSVRPATPPAVSVAPSPVPSLLTAPPRRKPSDDEIRAGADLSGCDLSGRDLSWHDLSGANLSDAYLSRTNLTGANLSDADLSGADLREADLSGANLSGANLHRADLSEADLHRADLSEADLRGANLRFANLSKADLIGADLSGAILEGAIGYTP